MKSLKIISTLVLTCTILLGAIAQNKTSNNVIKEIDNSQALTTLSKSIKNADLLDSLKEENLYTIFAPSNDAFNKLTKDAKNILLQTDNKEQLQEVLKYHIIIGDFSKDKILKAIKKGRGEAKFKMLNGGQLIALKQNDNIILKDESGNVSTLVLTDKTCSNGVIHIIDTLVIPSL
ncbi:fasciclin domain-containing protein [Winogradskyella endarachnes]|uniref:Fasciclin domain-containing protein n=1 Tax=Winogradskyella endarachnes TaxID=2681965 RepID=A0A6L6U539_9FLAO|nr:fasciclin domain-containing protein [Winogradskyella endarachnes]MUU77128.1 fasciclin domain-containing protein [Winogradskyella endarachnes]